MILFIIVTLTLFFFVSVSPCRDTDKRLWKYFLPYGMMRRRMLDVFGEKVGSGEKDQGFSGLVRAVCPYGLVLWWDDDGKNVRPVPVVAKGAGSRSTSLKVDTKGLESRIDALRAEMQKSNEHLELILLRALTGKVEQ